MTDPFANVQDEAPLTPATLRTELLADARRGYAPLRKVFVQQPNVSASRPSILGDMVRAKQETALRLFLLTLALQPLDGLTLSPQRWAGMLSAGHKPCSQPQLARAVVQLEQRNLVERAGTTRRLGLTPKLEDGSGDPYTRPTARGASVGKGFFVVPHDFWTTGLVDQLKLPGLAMFLICLHDTHLHPSFKVALAKTPQWYGVSERTAERGYNELASLQLLRTKPQKVADRNAPTGVRIDTWRALHDPYSKDAREALQAKTRSRARSQAKKNKKAKAQA